MELGTEQQQALQQVLEFLKQADEKCFLIHGGPGRGKSFLLGEIIKNLEDLGYNYCLCAPTHKAALVMQRYTGREAMTLHKLLSLSPILNIFELDLNNLLFKTSKNTLNIPYCGVVICDEASMINDELFELLKLKCEAFSSKLLFLGDFRQLSPVKQETISLIKDIPLQVQLTKNYRQSKDNALLPILDQLERKPINRFSEAKGSDGNLIIVNNTKTLILTACSQFRKAIKNNDILETKVTAFTNKRVNGYNQLIHTELFGDTEYSKGEFLTCRENLEFNNFKFYNCMDYVIITEPEKTDIKIPEVGVFPGWQFELWDSLENASASVSILSRVISEDYFELIGSKLEEARLNAVEISKISKLKAKKWWEMYYKILNSFAAPKSLYFDNRLIRKQSFTYGYACTTHLLQGSSLNSIIIDMKDINSCQDEEMRRQLQYVALSRTRKSALILQ